MLVDYVRVYQRTTPSNVPVLFTDEGAAGRWLSTQ